MFGSRLISDRSRSVETRMSALGYRAKNGVGSLSHATSMSEINTLMPSTLVKSRISRILSRPIL